jgi:tetratricopeptide (TPR) repeat protein
MVMRGAALGFGAALLAAGVPTALAPPAQAQGIGAATLPAGERAALLPVRQAIDARNWAGATAALQAARVSVRSAEGRYVVARLQLDIAEGAGDRQALTSAIIGVLEQRRSPPEEQIELLREYAGLIYDAGNAAAAEQTLSRAAALAPNDPEILAMLGQISRVRGNLPQALTYFQRAFRLAEASGRRMPETRYRLALGAAEIARQRPAAVEFGRQLVLNYPSPINWRDALIVFRTLGGPVEAGINLDALRLMRATGALSGERDYLTAARAFDQGGSASEAKAILEEAASRGMTAAGDAATRDLLATVTQHAAAERSGLAGRVTQARAATATGAQARTAGDLLLGQGRYAEAAELYRLALTRTGEDANLVNSRLGEALALAGQRAEGEAVLRAVTGPRAELATLWMAWAARPAA